MKPYRWKGITPEGKDIQGEIYAPNKTFLTLQLKKQKITILSINQSQTSLFLKKRKKISHHELTVFYRQLATLMKAGLPIIQGFDILLQHHNHPTFKTIIHSILRQLHAGKSLSVALQHHPHYFDSLSCQLIHIAEQTGNLDNMLIKISDYKEKSLVLKNKIIHALLYPIVILIVALLISISMLVFVIPQFTELFQLSNKKLPTFTLAVIKFSDFIRHDYWLCVFPIFFTAFVIIHSKKSPTLKLLIHQTILKIPLVGIIIKKFILARFSGTLSTILAAGLPLFDALKMTLPLHNNIVFASAIQHIGFEIAKGQRLYNAMQTHTLFPPLMLQMIKVGEESGTLEQMLEKITAFYEADIDYWTNNLSILLEPLIIIILGVLIGGLVIAMYLPIFKLGTVI